MYSILFVLNISFLIAVSEYYRHVIFDRLEPHFVKLIFEVFNLKADEVFWQNFLIFSSILFKYKV